MSPTARFLWTIIFLAVCINNASAAFIIQYSGLYHTYADDQTDMEYNRMHNGMFAGASIGRSSKLYLGPSYQIWNKTHKASEGASENEVSFTEFGATFIAFFDQERKWKVELTYNLSVKGERSNGTTNAELDGSGYRAGFGFQLPVNKNFSIGASLYYHAVTISSNVVSNTQTDTAESYTSMTPMVELSFRFF